MTSGGSPPVTRSTGWTGRAGPGPAERHAVVPAGPARPVPLDAEPLLARLGMVGERAVGEAGPPDRPLLLRDVRDPAGVRPPEAGEPADHRHDRAGPDR